MIEIVIPGAETLRLEHLVLDYNGTIAEDGGLLEGVEGKMGELAGRLQLHVLTADTHGTAVAKLAGLPCAVRIIGTEDQDRRKQEYVAALEAKMVAAVGNGRNDHLMLQSADVVCTDIIDVFDLFLHPARLVATLRN